MKKGQNKIANQFDIEANIIECDISYRGGRLMVDVSSLFPDVEDARMGASQNYLGGGIAGKITGGSMFNPDDLSKKDQKVFYALKERLKQYFHAVNNGGGDEYMQENYGSYEDNQRLSVSSY